VEKKKVLFLCTGNSARSQMAEAFLRKYGGDKFETFSAGLEPGQVNPYTIKVMEEIGIDMSEHRSKDLKEYMGKERFDYLITVCDKADKNCPAAFPGVEKRLHWSFEDPAKIEGRQPEKINKFRDRRDRIDRKIKEWLSDIFDPDDQAI